MVKEDPSSRSTVDHISSDNVTRDFITWSIFNTMFMNSCCLGFIAYAFSIKSRDRKMVGDMVGAQTNATTAKRLNIAAVIVSILTSIFLIILLKIQQT